MKRTTSEKCTQYSQQNQTSILRRLFALKTNNYPVVSIVNDKQFEFTSKCLQSKHLTLYNLHLS